MQNMDWRISSSWCFSFWRFDWIDVFLTLSCNEGLKFTLSAPWNLVLIAWELLSLTYLGRNLWKWHFEFFMRLLNDLRSPKHRSRLSLGLYIPFWLRYLIGKVEFVHKWSTLRWYWRLSFGMYLCTGSSTDTRMLAKSKLLCGIWTPWEVVVH